MKKILFTILFLFSSNLIFTQTMVVKKVDGTYIYIGIDTIVELVFNGPCPGTPTVDYAGKTYNTVQIGSQCWFKENLNVGTMINSSNGGTNSDGNQTNNSTIEKYCYGNDEANCTTYGGLYQWAEAVQYKNGATNSTSPSPPFYENVQGICPSGWHIPTKAEFETLKASSIVNNNSNTLKAVGQGTGSGAGTNTSGFSALLAGCRSYTSAFLTLGDYAYFWSSTEYGGPLYAHFLRLEPSVSSLPIYDTTKDFGLSVRCIKN